MTLGGGVHNTDKCTISGTLDIPNIGGIVYHRTNLRSELNCAGISCHAFSEFLGFRNTKKFRSFLLSLEESLCDSCHVYTGESNYIKKMARQ